MQALLAMIHNPGAKRKACVSSRVAPSDRGRAALCSDIVRPCKNLSDQHGEGPFEFARGARVLTASRRPVPMCRHVRTVRERQLATRVELEGELPVP